MVNSDVREWGNISGSLNYFLQQKIPKSHSVLDIGCHAGTLVHSIWLEGYESISGIDNNSASINKGKQKYQDIADRLTYYDGYKLPFKDNEFDVVTMFDVLEHIDDVQKFLSVEVGRVLKDGGLLVFQTPNKYTNIPWEIISHKSFSFYKRYHVSLQSYQSLYNLLKGSNFIDISIEKRDIHTPYYLTELKTKIGVFASPLLRIIDLFPVRWASNFWGHCRKAH